jgi:hypothetical protein
MANEKSQDKDEESQENLRDLNVINDENLTFGIPAKFFWLGFVSTIAFAVVLRAVWFLAPLWMLVYYLAIFGIHKDNPNAARAWQRALFRRPVVWGAGNHKKRTFIFLSNRE